MQREIQRIAIVTTVLLITLPIAGSIYFGSLQSVRAFIRGETCIVEPRIISIPPGPPDSDFYVTMRVTNLCRSPLRIIEYRAQCCPAGCINIPDAKQTIAAYDSTVIHMCVTRGQSHMRTRQAIYLFTDNFDCLSYPIYANFNNE